MEYNSLLYFVNRYSTLLFVKDEDNRSAALDELQNQFSTYQTVPDLPKSERADIQWHLIGQLRDSLGNPMFDSLARVMSGILSIPHCNADCERIFSLVRKTRTENRASMSNNTLESLLIQKVASLHQGPCHSQQFSDSMLKRAKSATYHALHCGQEQNQ
jgi:hypothetical protein